MTTPNVAGNAIGTDVRRLYHALIEAWNGRRADNFAGLFAEDGSMIGFDGSQVEGRQAIAGHLGGIFADHVTAPYRVKVREVRTIAPGVALLRAVAGMIPPGQDDINPAANAIQSLVASQRDGEWRIDLFQTTPAAWHGRPEDQQSLTDELRQLR